MTNLADGDVKHQNGRLHYFGDALFAFVDLETRPVLQLLVYLYQHQHTVGIVLEGGHLFKGLCVVA